MKRTLNQLGTFAIVTVVAVLVWLYAEDANIQEYSKQTVRVEFLKPQGIDGQIVPSAPITVEVDFAGSNGEYQQFIAITRGEVIQIRDLPFDPRIDLQTIDVDIQELLERDVFRGLGINVTGVSPERVQVTFEKEVNVTLDVQLVQDTGPIKLSSAQIPNESDRRLTLRLPAGQAERLRGVTALAYVRERDVRDVPKGGSKQFAVPIELPAGLADLPPVTANAGVVVTIANDRDTVTIDRRPVLLSYPSSINERYIIEIDESARFITAFELEGPREQVALIKADTSTPQVWATIRLTNEEVDKAAADTGELTKAVEIIAPAGVVPASVAERVTIRVKPRPAGVSP